MRSRGSPFRLAVGIALAVLVPGASALVVARPQAALAPLAVVPPVLIPTVRAPAAQPKPKPPVGRLLVERVRGGVPIYHPVRPLRLRPTNAARVIRKLRVKQRVVFITVDDGYHADARVVRLVKRFKLPLTIFLTQDAAKTRLPFYRALVREGARIESHTINHPFLPRMSPSHQHREICAPIKFYRARFGHRARMFRPPYGSFDGTTLRAAARCRLDVAVLWSAEIRRGRLLTDDGPLAPGDIILMHFRKELHGELQKLIRILRARKLGVGLLEEYVQVLGQSQTAPREALDTRRAYLPRAPAV